MAIMVKVGDGGREQRSRLVQGLEKGRRGPGGRARVKEGEIMN